jgi:hypothetical protein
MEDESIHNNHRDLVEGRFVRMEEKFDAISHNMTLLMETLN